MYFILFELSSKSLRKMVVFTRWTPFCKCGHKDSEKWSKVNIQLTTHMPWLMLRPTSPSPTLFQCGLAQNICYLLDLMKSECMWDLYHFRVKARRADTGFHLFLIIRQCSGVAFLLQLWSQHKDDMKLVTMDRWWACDLSGKYLWITDILEGVIICYVCVT